MRDSAQPGRFCPCVLLGQSDPSREFTPDNAGADAASLVDPPQKAGSLYAGDCVLAMPYQISCELRLIRDEPAVRICWRQRSRVSWIGDFVSGISCAVSVRDRMGRRQRRPVFATCQNIAHGYTGDTLTKRSLAWRTCADHVRLVGMPICFLFDLAWYRNDEPRRSKRFKAQ